MGNCSFKGVVDAEEQHCPTKTPIRVLSDSGRILQFQEAILVQEILTDFPGYGVFRQLGRLSSPLSGSESLVSGQLYYLLPLLKHQKCSTCFSVRETEHVQATETEQVEKKESQIVKDQKSSATETEQVEKKKKSQIVKSATETEQVKEELKCCAMETEQVEAKTEVVVVKNKKKKRSEMEPARMSSVDQLTNGSALEVLPSKGNGVWRVKLVINTKQLEEIFSEDVNTEALIEKMRNAASSSSSSESVTPRTGRAKSGWGVVTWMPSLYNVFKVKNDSSLNSK